MFADIEGLHHLLIKHKCVNQYSHIYALKWIDDVASHEYFIMAILLWLTTKKTSTVDDNIYAGKKNGNGHEQCDARRAQPHADYAPRTGAIESLFPRVFCLFRF